MFCSDCGAPTDSTAGFCPGCGAKVGGSAAGSRARVTRLHKRQACYRERVSLRGGVYRRAYEYKLMSSPTILFTIAHGSPERRKIITTHSKAAPI